MNIIEPNQIEALGLLGAMAQEQNLAKSKGNMGNTNNIIDECQTHITGFKLGAFMEARALLTNV